jgi:hypothetical protein
MPTRKWWAATIGEAATVLTVIVLSDAAGVTQSEWAAIIGLSSTRVIAWLTKNDPAQAGVEGQQGQP